MAALPLAHRLVNDVRLVIRFVGRRGGLRLPLQYNELIQGFIYRHLEDKVASRVHTDGFPDPRSLRRLRLFTFSRLFGRWRREGEHILFRGPVVLVVASPWNRFISSLATELLLSGAFQVNGQEVWVEGISVEGLPAYRCPVRVRTLSPITVYSTLRGPGGKRKTYYYSPFEQEFSGLLVKNLARKVRAWEGREVEAEGEIRPIKVSKRNEHVLKYKGTVIKAWSGVYELELPEALFRMAFDAGLGTKNSQGFGCIAMYKSPGDRR